MSAMSELHAEITDLLNDGIYRRDIVDMLCKKYSTCTEDFLWDQVDMVYDDIYEDYYAEPTEYDEWMDFDPDC